MLVWISFALAAEPDLLFVGNSYTFFHDLDAVSAELFRAGGDTPVSARIADPGLRWVDHVDRVNAGQPAWTAALKDQRHTWVFLQEQSQIPGFPQTNPEWTDSRAAATVLDGWARDGGAETVLLMTWGRLAGDPTQGDLYPDYPTMQGRLTAGYEAVAAGLSTPDRPVWIAPAGLAFQAIYDSEIAAGRDPLAAGGPFARLYEPDGSHPSPSGTFLVACTVYASVTGRSPVGLPGPKGLPADEVARLEGVVDALVIGQSVDLAYPWERTPLDTDAPETDAPGDSAANGQRSECGCQPGAGGSGAGLFLVAVGLRRSRRLGRSMSA